MEQAYRVRRWWPALAGGAALGAAVVFGLGGSVHTLAADEGKPVEKSPPAAPTFKPEDVRVGAPPELEALRKAVENAGKKGEYVEEIRKQLDALEKALTGRAWVKPQPPTEIVRPGQPPRFAQPARPFPQMQLPLFPDAGNLEADALRKMAEMLMRAQGNLAGNPQDADAMKKMMEEQQKLMRDMFGGLGGRIAAVPGITVGPRAVRIGEGRLGVRLENVPLVVADQLDLPAGRGLAVAEVVPGTAADKAGFKTSDIIIEFDGQPVTDDHHEMVKRVNEAKTGEKINVTVLRKGKKETLQVELPELKRGRADRGFPLPGPGVNSVQISVINGQFNVQATENGTTYSVKGEMADGQPALSEVTITEGDKTTTYDSLDKVPEVHREKVEGLLGKFGGRKPARID